jgi:hypothetical protein
MKITRIETFTVGRLLPILLVIGVSAFRKGSVVWGQVRCFAFLNHARRRARSRFLTLLWYEFSDWREEGERSQSSDSPWHNHPIEHEHPVEHEND